MGIREEITGRIISWFILMTSNEIEKLKKIYLVVRIGRNFVLKIPKKTTLTH